jgi:hypothetical protein
MKLVLKSISSQTSLADGSTGNTFDFIDEEGDVEGVIQIPVHSDSVGHLMGVLQGGPADEIAEEEPEEEPPVEEEPPPPPRRAPPVAIPPQGLRKRMPTPPSDDGVAPL